VSNILNCGAGSSSGDNGDDVDVVLVHHTNKSQHHATENIPGDSADCRQPQPWSGMDSGVVD